MAKDDVDDQLDIDDDVEDDEAEEDDEDLDLALDDDVALEGIAAADDPDDPDDDDADDDEADDEAAVADEAEESLDVLLAREAGDDDNLVRLDDEPRDGLVAVTTPIGHDEFTCHSCFLVKRRAQLADAKKMICFDCA